MNNYKQLIDRFETFSNNHPMIETFTWGELSDVGRNQEKIKFPLLHVIPTPSTIEDNYTDFNFQILIMDMLDDTEDNQLDCLNRSHLILKDFCDELINDRRDNSFFLQTPVPFDPFLDRLPTRVAGVDATVSIRVEGSFCL